MKNNENLFAGSIALLMALAASPALAAPTLPELEAKAADTKVLMEKVHAAKVDVDISEGKIMDLLKDNIVKKIRILAIKHDSCKEDRIQKRNRGQSEDARDAYDVIDEDRARQIADLEKLIQQNQIAIENERKVLSEKKAKLEQAKTEESNSEITLRSMAKEIHDANCGKRDLRRIQKSAVCGPVSAMNDRAGGGSPNRTPAGPIGSGSGEAVASSGSAR
ncbi:MAG: hypothetical protein EBT15_11170 [Betaproteobacteria bacterium]|nr:hypothetical protein [Betaproteobacteria bacterium]